MGAGILKPALFYIQHLLKLTIQKHKAPRPIDFDIGIREKESHKLWEIVRFVRQKRA
jgi:hypothetical protein